MSSAVFFLASLATAGAFSCPPGWRLFADWSNHCYWHSAQVKATWADAQLNCIAQDSRAHLASISDVIECDYIVDTVGAGQISTWIGLNDKVKEGIYVWSDGSPVRYFNWADGQPDNNGAGQDCIYIWHDNTVPVGKWDDESCGLTFAFVCEMPSIP